MASTARAVGALLIGLALCGIPAGIAVADEYELADVLNRNWFPTPAEQGHRVNDLSVGLGSIELKLRDGVAVPLLGADGEAVGLFYSGEGFYQYRSEDPIDRQVIERNVAKASALKVSDDYAVGEHFTEVLILSAGPWLETLTTQVQGKSELVQADASVSDKVSKLAGRQMYHNAHRLTGVRLNALEGYSYASMEIRGTRELASFEYDRSEDFVERLYITEKREGKWIGRLVSEQVLDGQDELPALTLREAEFDIATEDNRSGTVDSKLVLEVNREGSRYAQFYLVSHRDPRGSFVLDGASNTLEVKSITDEAGNVLPFVHARHELLVDLGSAKSRGDTVRLNVATAGGVFTGMGGERHDRYIELHSVNWYPTPLGINSPGFSFALRIKTAKPYRPVTSGKQVSLSEEGDGYVLESKRDRPSRHLAIYAGKYKTYEEIFDGLPIRVHSYAMQRVGLPEKMAKLANGIIRYYEEFLGPYPFEELDIIEVPEYGFGVAPSGVVLMTTEAYKPLAAFSAYFVRGVNARLAHEIAHHWFGHESMVGSPRDNWLSESFAEYASALAMEALKPKGSTKIMGFKEMHAVLAANQIAGSEAYQHRFGLLYNRGPLLLHMLRTSVGEEQFLAMMKSFLDRAGGGVATTDDFRAAVTQVRGRDMAWFFEQWVSRAGTPDVNFKYRVTARAGRQILSGTLDQSPEHFKTLVVPIFIDLGGGKQAVRVVFHKEPTVEFEFEIPGRPKRVQVDPNRNNLVRYHASGR
jgi:hypothetical protein